MKRILATLILLLIAASPRPAAAQEVVLEDAVEVVPIPPAPPEDTTQDTTTDAEKPQDPAEDDAPTPPAPKPPAAPPGTLKFHLMDGTIITGRLTAQALPIKTEFGDLVVPITAIVNFSPGLASHPAIDKQLNTLIEQLGDPSAKIRDKAQAELTTYGPALIPELQRYTDDKDPERKARIATIIEELYSIEQDFETDPGPTISLKRLDTIQTEHFTVAGEIQQDTFKIKSKFGDLSVRLADVKAAERITAEKLDLRKVVEIAGSDMAGRNYKNTGIRVNRGDKLIINAEGRITLTPWGNNVVSTPDGVPQNGMYMGNIPMGGLAGRIGDSGEEFMVGRKKSFVADKSGTLYLGFAMQANWQNYQFPGNYEARIRVIPAE